MKKTIQYSIVLLFYCLIGISSFAQNQKIDSLLAVLKIAKEDTNKVFLLNSLSSQNINTGNYEKGKKFAEKALQLSEKLNFKTGIASSELNIGLSYYNQGNYDDAMQHEVRSLEIFKEIGGKLSVAKVVSSIGNLHWGKGDYSKALEQYFQALKIYEEIKDKGGIANMYIAIGVIYYYQNNPDKSLEYYGQALPVLEEMGNKHYIALLLNNMGGMYRQQKKLDKALEHYEKSLKIREELGDKNGIADCFSNIGNIYQDQNKIQKGLEYHLKALKIIQEIGNKKDLGLVHAFIATIYFQIKDYQKSISYATQSLNYAKEVGSKDDIKNVYKILSDNYFTLGNHKDAYQYLHLHSQIKDSIFSEESNKAITEMSTKYETEKKEQQIKLLNKDKEIQAKDLARQKTIRNAVTGGMILVLLFSFVLINRFLLIRKQKKIIEDKNKNLEDANILISKQKEKITDSINYAKRIQEAILPAKQKIQEMFPDSFILYKPRDIVSGDFYWFTKKDGDVGTQHAVFLLAVADCTGHGVPGAFMSMIGNTNLNQIVNEKGITEPAAVLQQMHENIRLALKQDETDSQSRDGMDIALCSFTVETQHAVSLQFAGAYRPLWLVRNNALEEIKADKFPVAGYHITKERKFTSHKIELNKGDTVYLFTDGYADQFGGADGKIKFTTKRFKELLLSVQGKSMLEQEAILDKTIEEWKVNTQQMDDILLIGIKPNKI